MIKQSWIIPLATLCVASFGSGKDFISTDEMLKGAVPSPQAIFNFDRDALGIPPQGFTVSTGGEGPEIHWEVQRDALAPSRPNVLVQSGKARPGDNFALLILKNVVIAHGEVVVRFRTLSGQESQATGIVFRYQDPKNYDVLLADSHEDRCALYRIKKGKVKMLDAINTIVSPYTWHELRLTFTADKYTGLLDGEAVIGGKSPKEFGPGQVGLLTKSDSAIAFDDFRVSQ